jgi:hypothetical protein
MKVLFLTLGALAILVLIALRLVRGRIPAETKTVSAETVPPATPPKASDVRGLTITLDVNKQPSLFILLGADGSINRMGTGNLQNTERELFIGRADPSVFEALRSQVTEAMLGSLGHIYQRQDSTGLSCKLSLTFHFRDRTEDRLVFLYDSESEGAPSDVADLVKAAIRETDPWYENFKKAAGGRRQT